MDLYRKNGSGVVFHSNKCLIRDCIDAAEKDMPLGSLATPFDFVEIHGCLIDGKEKIGLHMAESLYVNDNVLYQLPVYPRITLSHLISEAKRIAEKIGDMNYKQFQISFYLSSPREPMTRGVRFEAFVLKPKS